MSSQNPLNILNRRGIVCLGVAGFALVSGTMAIYGGDPAKATGDATPRLQLEAMRALQESIPEVAVQKLLTLLADSSLNAEQRTEAERALAKAYMAAGQSREALDTIKPLVSRQDKAARLMYADIMGQTGRWQEALPVYRALASEPDTTMHARLGEVEALYALGESGRAISRLEAVLGRQDMPVAAKLRLASLYAEAGKVKKAKNLLPNIAPLIDGELAWKRYLEARLMLLDGRVEDARTAFQEILQRKPLPENILVGVTLGLCEARVILEGYESADREIETFIWQNPNSNYLGKMFRELERVYEKQDDPPASELQKWAAQKQPAERCALARYYLARMQMRERKWEKASRSLESFEQNFSAHPLMVEVHQMQAELLLQKRDFAGAIRALEAAERVVLDEDKRTAIQLRTGLVHFQAGDYLLAGNLFDMVTRHSPALREIALYNGALAALHFGNMARFEELFGTLRREFKESTLPSELFLERGLVQARTNNSQAGELLQGFLRAHPQHPRAAEARLALAELALQSSDLPQAEYYRKAANESAPSVELEDQSKFLAIFLADAQGAQAAQNPRRDEDVIALATAFIKERPQSPLMAEVRMKLGQVYFRKNDFANAETQFATLAKESPESPYAETALFLAGQSAMKSINTGAIDRALGEFFDQVIKKDGPLKLYARQQQAIAQSRLGKETETIAIYDIILNSQPGPDAELRYASLAGKGDSYLTLGRKEAKYLDDAVTVFGQLAAEPGVPVAWRNQALYKKAKALELLGKIPDALVAYYDVLDSNTGESREFLWYYKAGFDAARIFESQQQWKSAIGVYEKMARLEGPRTAEARAQMRQLRLEHFIWE